MEQPRPFQPGTPSSIVGKAQAQAPWSVETVIAAERLTDTAALVQMLARAAR
jgi:hypothetical protein